jgi:hypothetical protein
VKYRFTIETSALAIAALIQAAAGLDMTAEPRIETLPEHDKSVPPEYRDVTNVVELRSAREKAMLAEAEAEYKVSPPIHSAHPGGSVNPVRHRKSTKGHIDRNRPYFLRVADWLECAYGEMLAPVTTSDIVSYFNGEGDGDSLARVSVSTLESALPMLASVGYLTRYRHKRQVAYSRTLGTTLAELEQAYPTMADMHAELKKQRHPEQPELPVNGEAEEAA